MSILETNRTGKEYQAPRLVDIPGQNNEKGSVHFWENGELFPQGVLRCFWISGVKEGETRGNHAHWQETQVLIAIAGMIQIKVSGVDGSEMSFSLQSPGKGLLVPPLNWIEVVFSTDAVLLGLGDRIFSEQDYIRDKHYFGSIQ